MDTAISVWSSGGSMYRGGRRGKGSEGKIEEMIQRSSR